MELGFSERRRHEVWLRRRACCADIFRGHVRFACAGMLNDRVTTLLTELCAQTKEQKIEWERVAKGRYRWEAQAGTVTVWRMDADNTDEQPSMPEAMNESILSNATLADGTFAVTVQDPEKLPLLTISNRDVPAVKDLFETVRRRLFMVDQVVELLLKELSHEEE